MPTDWLSFIWGLLIGGVAAFATGFLKKAGEQTFATWHAKRNPGPPQHVQVNGRFTASRYRPSECAWVRDSEIYDYETKGYIYYPHPSNNAPCYRIIADGPKQRKEYLLVRPGAKVLG